MRQVSLSSPNYRILFMGDSFTEGVGFDYEQTFVGIVDEALAQHNVEVFNAGLGSYAPAIYFKKTEYLLKEVGLRFDSIVVFLDISDIEDEALSYDIEDGRVIWIGEYNSKAKEFIYEYTTVPRIVLNKVLKIWEKMRDSRESRRTDEEKRYGINRYRSLWTVDQNAYTDYGEVGLQKAQKNMDLLHGLVRREGIDMVLAVYPWPDQIVHHDHDSLQVKIWRKWAENHAIKFIDFFPSFIRDDQNLKQVIAEHYIPGDSHWNATGHRLIAKTFLEEWQRFYP